MQYSNFGRRSRRTPQTEPIPGSNQVKNSTGGYSFAVDDHTRLTRFLILGSASSTYYATQRQLTKENLDVVEKMLKEGNGRDVVTTIVEISKAGRAASNDPALFALARCAASDDSIVRQYALSVLSQVARTGTHLLHFIMYVQQFRGWSRGLRTAVASWFNDLPEHGLSYQLVKYQQRDGYSMRDVLRLAHPKAPTATYNAIYHWATHGWESVGDEPHPDEALQTIWAFERAKRVESDKEMAALIKQYKLPREAVPTQFLTSAGVWEVLLEAMPMEAMMRNLATMTRIGLIKPFAPALKTITARLQDGNAIRNARLHPIKILSALKTYESGQSVRGEHTWKPVQAIVDALDAAFYLSFGNVTPTGKNILLALDVSGSMEYGTIGSMPGLTPRVASAAMALVTANAEQNTHIMGFSHALVDVPISPRQRLDAALKIVDRVPMGMTDCSLPMLYAAQHNLNVDAFVIYTDSETYYNNHMHPVQALQTYRKKTGIPAKLVVVGMVSNGFSIADSNDKGMLDVVGFDTATPELISSFVKDEF